ncbi:lantibiotic dehydratase family protein [Puia sp. P3]|uniref:lantibiotic dehydratase family protein n=1 Tax=Puia sp. P3 TaxID=3423952 RepID=UPI003D66F720
MINSAIFKDKILREPLFSLDHLLRIPEEKKAFDAFVDSLYDNIRFRDAIFLSSPELFREWEKVRQGKDRGTVSLSIMKFFLRSISNTVPFGLFAAYSVNNEAPGHAATAGEFTRFSDIDSDYLIKLIARLNDHPAVKKIVRFRNNNTIYQVGEKYRYIEPSVVNRKLNYTLTSIEFSEVVRLLLDLNRQELAFDELVLAVVDNVEDVDAETAAGFIDELIRSKVFLSSLELALNEGDLLDQVIRVLEDAGGMVRSDEYLNIVIESLTEVRDRLIALDREVFNDHESYTAIFAALEKIGIEFDRKLIVCSNLRRNGAKFEDLEGKVQQLIGALERLSPPPSGNDNLVKFRERFYRRYEDAEVPLLEVLDNELGIGYLPDLEEHFVFSDLTDNIELPAKKVTQQKITITPAIYQFWQNCLLSGEKTIDLKQKDLSCFGTESTSLGTFSVMFSYANGRISLKNAGNSSATMLLGRFSSRDNSVRDMLNGIADVEAGYFKNEVLAEIVHLPNNRTANVTIRNIRRKAEISILSKNSGHAENILLEDLGVSVKGDKIVLRSRTSGKEVIPFLTSAQNYSFDSLPVYQFLCDLQMQSRRNYFTLHFGGLRLGMIDFFPRVSYGDDIILRKASWRLRKSEVLKLAGSKAEKITSDQLLAYVQKAELPKYVYFTEGNEDKMIIDTTNRTLLEILVQEINKRSMSRRWNASTISPKNRTTPTNTSIPAIRRTRSPWAGRVGQGRRRFADSLYPATNGSISNSIRAVSPPTISSSACSRR